MNDKKKKSFQDGEKKSTCSSKSEYENICSIIFWYSNTPIQV